MKPEIIAGAIVSFFDFDHPFTFFAEAEKDLIQNHHKRGVLYEREELCIIQAHAEKFGTFFDIGANIGNHAIFMAKVLAAKRVYAFEANPFTSKILDINVSLNGLTETIKTSYSSVGLGANIDALNVVYPQMHNLGAARLSASMQTQEAGYPVVKVPVVPLDSLNISPKERVSFVKLDVEGMELEVLTGADEFIARHRPKMFFEVDNKNAEGFIAWVEKKGYSIASRYRRYAANENFMIVPK